MSTLRYWTACAKRSITNKSKRMRYAHLLLKALTGQNMRDIPLGSVESKFYEKDGQTYYKISPILGLQTRVWGTFNLAKIKVIENSEHGLVFKQGHSKIEMLFSSFGLGTEKVRVTKYLFGVVPLGVQFCEISVRDKNFLREQFKCS